MSGNEWPKGHLSQWQQVVDRMKSQPIVEQFDMALAPELQTNKELVKIVPCQYCQRALIVSTFYVMAWAKCRLCKGESDSSRSTASVGQPQAGRTEPRLARDLTKVLINPSFAEALCPVHRDDPDHEMELKSVSWSDHYGPVEWRLLDGKLTPVQIAAGETALLQCKKCNATVAYSTTVVTQLRRANEVEEHSHKHSNGWEQTLGARDDNLEAWAEKVDEFDPPSLEEVAEDGAVAAE